MPDIYDEIKAERVRQDEKWGGPGHDDQHVVAQWVDYITLRARRASLADGWLTNHPHTDPQEVRRCFIEVAALAIAAVESLDRQEAPDA